MKAAAILLAAVSFSSMWQQAKRETNSHAATSRGVEQFERKQYNEAADSFTTAASTVRSPQSAFNLGTSQIAAGKRAEGAAALEKALKDPALRPDALYNRGNGALASKQYEHAIRDYTAGLKLRPGDAQAKRNLEIAIAQQQAQRRAQTGNRGGKQGDQQQQPQPPQPKASSNEDRRQDADGEALLRSVQQQEQEEMQRMKKARMRSGRVGW
ncbi:MAG: tetratricopeptide repeat protein [Thermoanaerobaculia bacterium]|nr:tetratricopeptide repeat protein [Thermoanaerobaculia bacterium]